MKQKFTKILKFTLFILFLLIVAFIAFVLNETKDEIHADLNNVEKKLEDLYNPEEIAGFAVSVFNQDSVFYTNSFGYSDLEKQIPYTNQTQQYIASVSKTTIGIALMKAEELGLLDISDPINKHLPFEVSNPSFPKIDITIEQLATHTSSLDYNEEVVESNYIKETDKEESLESFMTAYFKNERYGKVMFTEDAPGTNWNYSNIGSSLAAFIIERASGLSFSAFTKKHIFQPLALNDTHWFASESDSLLHTKYYEPTENSIKEVKSDGIQMYPSRDLITNIDDLTRYCQAIIAKDSRLLNSNSFNKLLLHRLDASVANQEEDNNGLFFMMDRNQYGITYQLTGMSGGDNCINTMMWFDTYTNLGYIFIGNTGGTQLNRVSHIRIYRTLVSLGDNVLMEGSTTSEKVKYKWHNLYNRVRGLF